MKRPIVFRPKHYAKKVQHGVTRVPNIVGHDFGRRQATGGRHVIDVKAAALPSGKNG